MLTALGQYKHLYVPAFIVIALAYYNYAVAYVIGYTEIYHHRSVAGAIVLWVFMAILQLSMLSSWLLIFIRGPGKAPSIPPFDLYHLNDPEYLPVPSIFLCDEQGYPFWCSACQSIKPKRAFHSSALGYCVARFDHNCVWIGSIIGKNNLVPFYHFCVNFDAMFIMALIAAACTVQEVTNRESLDLPHYVVVFILSVFWIMMITAVFAVQVYLLIWNRTTMDDIAVQQTKRYSRWQYRQKRILNKSYKWLYPSKPPRNESGIRYVNLLHDGTRKVVSFGVKESPYDCGFRSNLTRLVLGSDDPRLFLPAALFCILPFAPLFHNPKNYVDEVPNYENCSEPFSLAFIVSINEKISHGDYTYPSYLQAPQSPSRNDSRSNINNTSPKKTEFTEKLSEANIDDNDVSNLS